MSYDEYRRISVSKKQKEEGLWNLSTVGECS